MFFEQAFSHRASATVARADKQNRNLRHFKELRFGIGAWPEYFEDFLAYPDDRAAFGIFTSSAIENHIEPTPKLLRNADRFDGGRLSADICAWRDNRICRLR
jgi:hypothetical protein